MNTNIRYCENYGEFHLWIIVDNNNFILPRIGETVIFKGVAFIIIDIIHRMDDGEQNFIGYQKTIEIQLKKKH